MADEPIIKKILLVEDDEAHVELISCAFENFSEGRSVIINASTVGEAAGMIKSQNFDIAISDYKLPDGGGGRPGHKARGARPQAPCVSGKQHKIGF